MKLQLYHLKFANQKSLQRQNMSFEEFNNWDPMQDDFNASNSHKGHRSHGPRETRGHFPCFGSLFINFIHTDMGEDTLAHIFSKYGKVKSVFIKPPKGDHTFGFVHFDSAEEALSVYHKVPKNLYGLHVELARVSKTQKSVHNEHNRRNDQQQYWSDHVDEGNDANDYVDNSTHLYLQPLKIKCQGSGRSVLLPTPDSSVMEHACIQNCNTVNWHYGHNDEESGYEEHEPHRSTHHNHQEQVPSARSNIYHMHMPARHAIGCCGDACTEYETLVTEADPMILHNNCVGDHRHVYDDVEKSYVSHIVESCCAKRSFDQDKSISCQSHRNLPPLKKNSAFCSYCGMEGDYVCIVCNIPYCSRKCQEADWPKHMAECKALESVIKPIDRQEPHLLSAHYPAVNNQSRKSQVTYHSSLSDTDSKSDTASYRKEAVRGKVLQNHSGVNRKVQTLNELPHLNNCNEGNEHVQQPKNNFQSAGKEGKLAKPQLNHVSPVMANCQQNRFREKPDAPRRSLSAKSSARPNSLVSVPHKIKFSSIVTSTLNIADNEKVRVSFLKSPDLFWIHRLKDLNILSQIENTLSDLLKQKTPYTQPCVDDVCALHLNNKLYRCRVIKLTPQNKCELYQIDYGRTVVSEVSCMFHITPSIAAYPALAICCKLAYQKTKKNWEKEQLEFFAYLVEDKNLDACVIEESYPKLTIDLITGDGLNVSSVLLEKLSDSIIPVTTESGDARGLMFDVPSVIKFLKVNMTLGISYVYGEGSSFCGWAAITEVLEKFQAMEAEIKKVPKKDITITAEEGDIVIALSPLYNIWYRCLVKKRLKTSFIVYYIDYGNEEEVFELFEIPAKHVTVPSPLLHIDLADLKKDMIAAVSLSGLNCVVNSINEDSIELTLQHGGVMYKLHAHPWLPGTECMKEKMSSCTTVKVQTNSHNSNKPSVVAAKDKSPQERNTSSSIQQNTSSSKKDSDFKKMIMLQRNISVESRTPVMVQWVKDLNNVFIQKVSDIPSIKELSYKINEYCNLNASKHIPLEGDLVYAKYSVDQMWYRAHVSKVLPHDKFQVSFIDYGNDDEVFVTDLRFMGEQFCTPKFSVCVSLCNSPTEITADKLLAQLWGKVFDLEVVDSKTTPMKVKLYHDGKEVLSSGGKKSVTEKPVQVLKKSFLKYPSISDFNSVGVQICHVDSSNVFHVQRMLNKDDYTALKKEMGRVYKEHKGEYVPKVDDLVSVNSNGEYHRGVIVKVFKKTCTIEFVDEGFSKEIAWDQIRPVRSCLPVPILSLGVVLDGVDAKFLTQDVIDNLKIAAVNIKIVDSSSIPAKVEFYIGNKCVNKILQESDTTDSTQPIDSHHIKTFKHKTLPLNEIVKVVFCYIENGEYFLQKVSDIEDVDKLSKALEEHCQKSKPLSSLPSPYQVVCAKSADNAWYRAYVKNVLPNERLEVIYVDYGNSEIVEKVNLCAFPEELTMLPIYGISVGVKNVPEDLNLGQIYSVHTSGTTDNLIVEFGNVKKGEKSPQPHVVPHSSFFFDEFKHQTLPLNQTLEVIFWFKDGDKYYLHNKSDIESVQKVSSAITEHASKTEPLQHSVVQNEVLCARSSVDQCWYRAYVKEILNDSTFNVTFIDYGNSEVVHFNDLRSLPKSVAKFRVFAIPVEVRNVSQSIEFGVIYPVKSSGTVDSPVVEISPVVQDVTMQELCNEVVVQKPKPEDIVLINALEQQRLPINKTVDVMFCFKEKDFCFLQQVGDTEDILKMSTLMQAYCTESETLKIEPVIGEVVCAKSSVDCVWYRACVQKVLNGKLVEVIFIDYGNTETVGIKDVRHLSKELGSFPIYGIQVMVKNAPKPLVFETMYSVYISGTEQNPIADFASISEVSQQYPIKSASHQPVLISSMTQQHLPINEMLDVVFWFRENDKLYLQKLQDVELIVAMCAIMEKHCADSEPLKTDVIIGEVLCAKSSADNTWYRGCIKSFVSEDKYDVHFIDYGNNEVIHKSNLRVLSKELSEMPVYGIEVVACDIPESLVYGTPCVVHTSGTAQEPAVKFELPESQKPSCSVPEEKLIVNTTQEVNELPSISNNTSTSVNLSNFRYIDFPLGMTTVIIYSLTSVEHLFCAPFNSENIQAMADLQQQILKFCNSQSSVCYKPETVNELVLAKDPGDDCWYRAAVIGIDDDSISVCFVDYGGADAVSPKFVKRMELQFLELPIQAHLCKLDISLAPEDIDAANAEIVDFIEPFSTFEANVSKEGEIFVLDMPFIRKHLEGKGLLSRTGS